MRRFYRRPAPARSVGSMRLDLLTHRSALVLDPAAARPDSGSFATDGRVLAVTAAQDGPLVVHAYVDEEVPDAARARPSEEVGELRVSSGAVALAADDGRTISPAVAIDPGLYRATRWRPAYPEGFLAARTARALDAKEREALGAMNIFIFTTFGTFIAMAVVCLASGISYAWGYLVPLAVGLAMIGWARRVHRRGDATYAATLGACPSVVIRLTRVG
jgi:hypothetical protein